MAAPTQKVTTEDVFGGAPTPITETPEFKAALKEAVAEALKGFAPAAAQSAMPEGAMGLFREMALAIAEMTHQGDKRSRPVDPKVLMAREAAQKELNEALHQVALARKAAADKKYDSEEERDEAIRAVTPRYRCIAMCVLDDVMIVPWKRNDATKKMEPVPFYWAQEPNDAMIPLNDLAKEIHKLFRRSRGARSDIEKRSVKPAWATDRGLIIEGGTPPARREIETRDAVMRDRDSDLDIPEAIDPSAPFVHVLGTKHAPAQKNYEGKVP